MLYHDLIPLLPDRSSHHIHYVLATPSLSFTYHFFPPPSPSCPRLETLHLSLEPGRFSEPGPFWKSRKTRHRLSAAPIRNNSTQKAQSLAADWEQITSRVVAPICSKPKANTVCRSAVSVLQCPTLKTILSGKVGGVG